VSVFEKKKYTPEARARASALGSLAMREHSCDELRKKLVNKQHDAIVVDQLIIDLLKDNLISDARYSESYWRSRSNKGYGPSRISKELEMKGVAAQIIASSKVEAGIDFFKVVEAVYLKKYKGQSWQAQKEHAYKEKAKRQAFLYRRGFDTDYIKHAFSHAEGQTA
jgi:regulatory protein